MDCDVSARPPADGPAPRRRATPDKTGGAHPASDRDTPARRSGPRGSNGRAVRRSPSAKPLASDGTRQKPTGSAESRRADGPTRGDELSLEGLDLDLSEMGKVTDDPALGHAESTTRIDRVLSPCQELLEDALSRLNSGAGVLYGVDEHGLKVLGAVSVDVPDDLLVIERAATAGFESRRPLLARGRTFASGAQGAIAQGAPAPDSRAGNGHDREQLLVVPCTLQGDVAAVLVASRPGSASETVDADLQRLGPTVALGLAADRARIHFTLADRMSEAEGIRRQLEAYAVDLRSVFLSERARSDELGQALVELEETYEATVRGLAIAVESKDEYTGGHLYRVSRYGMTITAIVAPQHRDDPQFEYGFLLHDVGKLAVPDAVLLKSGALTEEEWEQIRAHPASGRTILERIPFLAGASEIVFCHHERWDGKGFPRGLSGEDIPLGARIFPIADAFDAMTTSRPYRKAIPIAEAREELVRGSGTQFWPDAVDAFMSIPIEELETVQRGTRGTSDW
jgi:HD-GYP domain-containing protein (c-di-GMP phosphodiesterase class II)